MSGVFCASYAVVIFYICYVILRFIHDAINYKNLNSTISLAYSEAFVMQCVVTPTFMDVWLRSLF